MAVFTATIYSCLLS